MATVEKSKSQTYNFLSENKSIEDIKQQRKIEVIEKSRHGGSSFKLVEKNNANHQPVNDDPISENNRKNLEPVTSNLINNEKEQEINNDIWTKFKNYLNWPTSNTEELIQAQRNIQELEKEIQQLKKQIESLKQSNKNDLNFKKYTYNVITIYDEKQSKKTGIKKIYEEILPIEDKIIFITTFIHIDNSITEEIIHFYQLANGDIQVVKQIKNYKNISEYKKDISLIEENSNHEKNIKIELLSIKDFLKQQHSYKLKPTKKEKTLWYIFTGITLLIVISPLLLLVPQIAIIGALATAIQVTAGIMGGTRIFASLFSSATRKVDLWFGNKLYKDKEQKDIEKNERQSIIKNLSTDKLETKLETQYDILKQELDNRKEKNTDKLISNNKINHKLNSVLENSSVESLNPSNFDSSIWDTVNNQDPQPSTSSNHNWNKVKCLFT